MILWEPSQEQVNRSRMTDWIRKKGFQSYSDLHNFSIENPDDFWLSLLNELEIKLSSKPSSAYLKKEKFQDTVWYPGAKINFSENILKYNDEKTAIVYHSENTDLPVRKYTYRQLHDECIAYQALFKKQGIQPGDRIAAILPNMPETIFTMLSATSLGAVFSSCSPDFGPRGVIDRFGQIEPEILVACDGYEFKGKWIDTVDLVRSVCNEIPSIKKVYFIRYHGKNENSGDISQVHQAEWLSSALSEIGELPRSMDFSFQAGFDHPVYIMYSSGTTGLPKCMVQGPGVLVNQKKEHIFHVDLNRNDSIFYFTTCGWMMWNWLVSALSVGATILLYDGNPFYPTADRLLQLAEKEQCTVFGTSARYLAYLEKSDPDLSSIKFPDLRTILSTGSPLLPEQFDYVYDKIKKDVQLSSISGGTDLNGCFVLGNPVLPVRRGEIQCKALGMDVHVFSEDGQSIINQEGELVCLQPFVSMPLYFWDDPDGKKYQSAYFDKFNNIWRHGDYMKQNPNGGFIISGRSDATLNPGGVRIGTADIYRVVESRFDEIADSLIIGQSYEGDVRIILFIQLKSGFSMSDDLVERMKSQIRKDTSPRHVPSIILKVKEIPYTRSMKKLELAVKNIFEGKEVKNKEAISNPEALIEYEELFRSIH